MIGSSSGTQRIVANHAEGALWTVVQNLVASEYDLCGEWGAAPDGRRVVYVASRRGATQTLRLLVVDRVADSGTPGSMESYEVGFHDVLDETIPARARLCPNCSHRLLTWAAICPDCKQSTAPNAIPRGEWTRKDARSAIAIAINSEPTLLGELSTAAGSVVAIVRNEKIGETVALTFERIENFPGEMEAVPIGPLRRPRGGTGRRPASPHSGEIGPLAAGERAMVTGGGLGTGQINTPSQVPDAPLVCPKCQSRYEGDIQFCPVDGETLTKAIDGTDLVGQVLNEKFRILQLLGEGGMGRVYLAEHVMIGRRCALKVLSPALVGHPESIRRFAGEARNASRIQHPNVAIVYDFEKTPDGLVYLVLEFVDGETLGAILARELWLDVTRAVRIVRDTADALQAAHDLGIVHRDLKPDNIMIAKTSTGEELVKVVDFGIAKAAAEQAGSNARVTRTGFVVGTPRYMSPEQLTDETVDARSDVYSLGCVAFEAITGRSAFKSSNDKHHSLRQPRLRDDAPKALDAIIRRAMSRSPDDRYQTAQAMRDDLDDLLGKIDRRGAAMRRNAVLRIAAIIVVAAAIGTGAWAYFTGRFGIHQTRVAEVPPAPAVVPVPIPTAATPPVAPHRPHTTPPAVTPVSTTPAAAPVRAGSESDRYLAMVDSAVRSAWHQALNGTTPTGTERATFHVTIGPAGRILHITPVHLSDVPAYDDAVGVAVQNIPSFAPPPASLAHDHEGLTLRLGFQGSDVFVHVLSDSATTAPATTSTDH